MYIKAEGVRHLRTDSTPPAHIPSTMLSLSPLTGLFVLFAMTCVKAETIMVPGIGSPPASPSVLGGLLGRNIVERQIIRCRDPTATRELIHAVYFSVTKLT